MTTEEAGIFTEPGTIVFRRLLPGPVDRVWAYLTESDKRGLWLASGEMSLKVGGRVELEFRHADLSPTADAIPGRHSGDGVSFTGRITRCEPPRVLAYTWAESWGEDSEVTFELTPQGDAVLLVLTHRRLGKRRDALISVAAGWHTHLGILVDRLNGIEPQPFWTVHSRREAEYARRLAE